MQATGSVKRGDGRGDQAPLQPYRQRPEMARRCSCSKVDCSMLESASQIIFKRRMYVYEGGQIGRTRSLFGVARPKLPFLIDPVAISTLLNYYTNLRIQTCALRRAVALDTRIPLDMHMIRREKTKKTMLALLACCACFQYYCLC